MNDFLKGPPEVSKKLPFNFVEEAGVRFFENKEGSDWYDAIHQLLQESGIEMPSEDIRNLFLSLPESGDDEDFELALISHMFNNKLITREQVEGEEWEHLFMRLEELSTLDQTDIDKVVAQAHQSTDNQMGSSAA